MKARLAAIVLVTAMLLGLGACAGAPRAAGGSDNPGSNPAATSPAPLPPDAVISWTDDAAAAFKAEVPKAVQKIARKQMEKEARERGIALIDMAFYNQIKKEQGR
jgi:hypothetical protein